MKETVLLVVDVQRGLIANKPYNLENFKGNLSLIIEKARAFNVEVIYVRHDDGVGSDLQYGTDRWEIFEGVVPKEGERIFEKKYNSAFFRSNLKNYLEYKDIKNIILTGLQTEYCIDATCKSAFELGFNVIIPEGANSTFNNDIVSAEKIYEFFNYRIWDKRFAKVMAVEQVIELFREL